MINKAMIEIPPKFANQAPVNPDARQNIFGASPRKGAAGLAEDVRYYGEWMKREAFIRIGHLYPKVQAPKEQGGGEATVIAWIWARTVKCPNPACGCEMPLVRSFELSKKKDAYVEPVISNGYISYQVNIGKNVSKGSVNRKGARCICCGTYVGFPYIRDEGKQGHIGSRLIAIVAEGSNERIYVTPVENHVRAAQIKKPADYPDAQIIFNPRDFKTPNYGLTNFSDLFTNRQLTALTTFRDLVSEAQKKAEADALAADRPGDGVPLADGGTGAKAYGQAVGVYLAFAVDKMADYHSSISSWNASKDQVRNVFARQAIPMVWDFAETNPFSNSSGCFDNCLEWIFKCIGCLPANASAFVYQCDAQSHRALPGIVVSTDPPYYNNINYADLSDFFYIWLRQSLKNTYPEIFKTLLVPKSEELIATPYRFDGSVTKARDFFEDGMFKVFERVNTYSTIDIPVTIYYAFKQSETDKDKAGDQHSASTGWETMLSAVIRAGFSITGTWPMRTEMASRSIALSTNALASSIVLVCRRRPAEAPKSSRKDFINALKRELKPALHKLQQSNIAPVDLAQSAIGPGMGVYSRYSMVLEADGTAMSVRSALQIINQELDLFFSEQDGELDSYTRFCLDLYSQCAFNDMKFGEADVLARAKNTSVERLNVNGVLHSQKGLIHLLERADVPEKINDKILWLLTQQLTRAMETGGVNACAQIAAELLGSSADRAKALAYRLFTIAEHKGWTQEAYAYNSLVIAWPEIQTKVDDIHSDKPVPNYLF
jgi:putative DNA methylase